MKIRWIKETAMLLCLALGCLHLSGCRTGVSGEDATIGELPTFIYRDPLSELDYDTASSLVYDSALGEFFAAYEVATEQKSDAMRYAMMAIAEAKLLESGVFLPLSANGGNYAISSLVPNSTPYALWGNDADRLWSALVTTTPIRAVDRAHLKEAWARLRGSGEYYAYAKDYLEKQGYTRKNVYCVGYASDPQTWDVHATSKSADAEALVHTYAGLYEYDCEGVLQPALAESYTVSNDGKIYTFTLRRGVSFVDSQGNPVGEVRAEDFVAGFVHMLDTLGGLEYLVQGVIKNADAYVNGTLSDTQELGVRAIDDYTLEYTLEEPTSYFMTMLGYGVFAPLCRSYYVSKGGAFGTGWNASKDYVYGIGPDHIAYCGPFRVTGHTAKTKTVYQKNNAYFDVDRVTLDRFERLYDDGTDVMKGYNDQRAGLLDSVTLNASSIVTAKNQTEGGKSRFALYAFTEPTAATTYNAFFNLNRRSYANADDPKSAISSMSERERLFSNAAMRNQSFRLALALSQDRSAYNAQKVGEELKLSSLRNSYTPGTFVFLDEDVTVPIGYRLVSFPKGTPYGAIVQAQLDADKIPIRVFDPEADGGVGSSDGFDGWFSEEKAREYFKKALGELRQIGVVATKEMPIALDLPTYTGSEIFLNRANVFKQCVERASGGLVRVNLVRCPTNADWYRAGYYCGLGNEMNYTVYDVSGWGPDYGDPSTYLDTMLPDYRGYMTKMLGLF